MLWGLKVSVQSKQRCTALSPHCNKRDRASLFLVSIFVRGAHQCNACTEVNCEPCSWILDSTVLFVCFMLGGKVFIAGKITVFECFTKVIIGGMAW